MDGPIRERILTPALAAFLVVVLGLVAASLATRRPSPDLEGCIELLADGDLDRDERRFVLERTAMLGAGAASARGRVAGCLACLALEDREGFAAARAALDADLAPVERRWLGLGDPLLSNVLVATASGRAGRADDAAVRWGQIAAQARMTGNQLAAEFAASHQSRK